jgi:hypothetical protein
VHSKSAGMTIIESMIYCAILMWMSTLLAVLAYQYISSMKGLAVRCTAMTDIHLALDSIIKDVSQAVPEKNNWSIADNKIIFSAAGQHIGWFQQADKLLRFAGTYNKETGTWSDHGNSLAVGTITGVSFAPVYDPSSEKVTAIHVEITTQIAPNTFTVKGIAYLLNGRVV